MIVAKFQCLRSDRNAHFENIEMEPVYDDSPENKSWSEATPAGSLKMTISNKAAIGQLVPGKSYILRFEPVEENG